MPTTLLSLCRNNVCFVLMLAVVFAFGCKDGASKPTPDPLATFHFSSLESLHSNKTIGDDYQDYLNKLAPDEREVIGSIDYHEDGTGQHAVEMKIGVKGTWWEHILIYDKENKRIRAVKYMTGGGYRS